MLVGLVAGMGGRIVDAVLMRIMDAMMSVPMIILALFLGTIFGKGLGNICVAIGICMIPSYARVTRGQVPSFTIPPQLAVGGLMPIPRKLGTMSNKLLSIRNLSVDYNTEISRVYAVNGLSFDRSFPAPPSFCPCCAPEAPLKSGAQRLETIEGMIPDPSVKIEGCRFAQRCKFATQRCKADPGMIQVAPDHMIRCHLFDKRTEG